MSQDFEDEHVHHVYEQIAHHFSSTRYKPWPLVEKFLNGLPDGSVGLDVGCGNGKYLAVNPNVFILGSDRSETLARIAASTGHQPHSAIVAENLSLPHPAARFDFAISVAVVHHLSSSSRRVAAIAEVLRTLRIPEAHELQKSESQARALIYVWALEQKGSRRGWDVSDSQDVIVPWVMKGKKHGTASKAEVSCNTEQSGDTTYVRNGEEEEEGKRVENSSTFQRYYHLYREGELERDISAAGGIVLSSGYEKDNWWAIARCASR
ncbi:MAG: tRNA methyltransferase, has a role in tRNA modification [Peltula sp. TS41687]|nr:MAG: tRNA methyltransferase, has a role in tRNA modification [Peltula sp. TS41687]